MSDGGNELCGQVAAIEPAAVFISRHVGEVLPVGRGFIMASAYAYLERCLFLVMVFILPGPGERKESGRRINEHLAVCLCGVTNWLAVRHELSANEERRLAGQAR